MTSAPKSPPEISVSPILNLDHLATEWCALERQSVNHSFFLSWYWIGSWLRTLPKEIRPQLLRIHSGERTHGLAVIVQGHAPVLKFFSLPQIALNATGEAGLDNIAIEYNGFLAAGGFEEMVTRSGLEWLLNGDLSSQSVLLPGIDTMLGNVALSMAGDDGRQVAWLNEVPAPYVDLRHIRNKGGDYLSLLSRNTRQMMRRSLRHYEAIGPLRYDSAHSLDEALQLFDALAQAHQTYWRARGQPGAFAKPYFRLFHEMLIRSAFADGHIEMARIAAGDTVVGYLYNFLWRDTIYAYQSGFLYGEDNLARPGYVSHYMAILTALERGYNVYDFMAGIRQHKTSLSTGQQNLTWLQLQKPILPVRIQTSMKTIITKIHRQVNVRPV